MELIIYFFLGFKNETKKNLGEQGTKKAP